MRQVRRASARLGATAMDTAQTSMKVGSNATLNGTIHVTYATTWTPADGDYVRVLDCAGTISGTPTFDLQALPEGLAWDTSSLFAQGVIKVVSATGISGINASTEFEADVYTLSGIKLISGIKTSKSSLERDLKSQGLGAGTYIVRSGSSIKVTF